MPKHLFLMRHAEAAEKMPHSPDIERQLTTKGLNQAVQTGAQLLAFGIPIDGIVSSTAERARQTASLAADAMKFDSRKVIFDEEIYSASARTLFNFVTNLDDALSSVMIVGHNPTLTYLSEYLTQEVIGDMSPGSVVVMIFDVSTWKEVSQGNAKLMKYLQPMALDVNNE